MSENFWALTLSYKTASVSIRERAALSNTELIAFLGSIKQYTKATEAFVLSTCNRTEIYYSADENLSKELILLLALTKGIGSAEEIKPYFQEINNTKEATRHLFRVALGLEAQILGDLQIINQVKKAYQATADMQLAGPFLHRLLHTIFFANKKVQQETAFRDGAASVSYATTELIYELSENIANPQILVAGLGEIGADTVRNLVAHGGAEIWVCNRTYEKSQKLAEELEHKIKVIPFEDLAVAVQQADVLVSGINTGSHFFTGEFFGQIEGIKLLIDLGMPRSIDPDLENTPGILLYNIDQINDKVNQALAKREAAIPAVNAIIEAAIAEFEDWSKEMIVSPTINKLKNALEQIRQEELLRYVKQMDAEQQDLVDKVTKNLMQKVLKLPVLQLKAACKRGEAETLIDVLNDLFNLEKVENQSVH
jgi:glutamyl-tRNA reductase